MKSLPPPTANKPWRPCAKRKEKPDLVLLDIMMSYILDGLDVGREMAEDAELKEILVIMVTSLTRARA